VEGGFRNAKCLIKTVVLNKLKRKEHLGKRVFDSVFTDDLVKKLFDPDYAPEIGELEEGISDTDEENSTCNFNPA